MFAQSRNKYLLKNTLLFSLNTICTRIIVFFLVPVYTKALSTFEYGVVDLVTTVITIAAPVITMNIGEAIMRFSLDKNANYDEVNSVGVLFAVISSLIGVLIIPLCKTVESLNGYSYLIYLYCISFGVEQIIIFSLRGQEKLLEFAIANIVNTFISATLNIWFLLFKGAGVSGYFISFIIANLITIVYGVFAGNMKSTIDHFTINRELMEKMVKYSIVLVPNTFMWWIMNSSDRIMVTSMVGEAANGIYGISYKLPTILTTLSTVFNQAWNYSAIHEEDSIDVEEYSNRTFNYLFFMLALSAGLLMLIMKPLLRIYVPEAYYSAWEYTPFLLIGFFFMSLGTFLSSQYTVHKDSKAFLISGSVGAFVNIVLNFLLIPRMGVLGAALATCMSYICVFIYRVFDTRRYLQYNVWTIKNIVTIILLLITAVSMYTHAMLGIIAFVVLILFRVEIMVNIINQVRTFFAERVN